MSNIVEAIVPSGYVGFDSITRQIEQRLVRRGFQFNLMVVGSSGLGKTTLINSLFASHLVDSHGRKDVTEPIKRTSEISVTSRELQEKNVRLKLNLIDTPGFGDQVNNDRCWEPIVRYIKDQYSHYLRRELTPQRERFIPDTRVHCVLYFIRPHSLGLQELDVVVLKHLTEIVNVVPVIAKSDTLTLEERAEFKRVVQAQLAEYNLTIYPYDAEGLLEEERLQNAEIRRALPFAVVGSENSITIDGKTVRGRKTRWGAINIEDKNHCEFIYLRDFLTRTHLQDLIETTALIHYESFRSKQLLALKENTSHGRQKGY